MSLVIKGLLFLNGLIEILNSVATAQRKADYYLVLCR